MSNDNFHRFSVVSCHDLNDVHHVFLTVEGHLFRAPALVTDWQAADASTPCEATVAAVTPTGCESWKLQADGNVIRAKQVSGRGGASAEGTATVEVRTSIAMPTPHGTLIAAPSPCDAEYPGFLVTIAETDTALALIEYIPGGEGISDYDPKNPDEMDRQAMEVPPERRRRAKGGTEEVAPGFVSRAWPDEKGIQEFHYRCFHYGYRCEQTVAVPKSVIETINGFVNADNEEAYQGEDNTITYTAKFPNGYEIDVKCCGSDDSPSWLEAVLFDGNGGQLCCTEPEYSEILGDWEMEFEGCIYVAHVVPEPEAKAEGESR